MTNKIKRNTTEPTGINVGSARNVPNEGGKTSAKVAKKVIKTKVEKDTHVVPGRPVKEGKPVPENTEGEPHAVPAQTQCSRTHRKEGRLDPSPNGSPRA